MSGPRLCALRISNASGNVLIDNVESNSTPIVYRRRSRFVDEELDETKDIITTHCFPISAQCEEERAYHRISMLMSNGATIDTSNDTCMADLQPCPPPFSQITPTSLHSDGLHQPTDVHFQPNQPPDASTPDDGLCTSQLDMIGFDGAEAALEDGCDSAAHTHQHPSVVSGDNVSSAAVHSPAIEPIAHEPNETQQFLNMHQLRQSRSMSFAEETSILRRRQLSRVAEWVQNNSNHRTCLDGATACETQHIDGNVS